MMTECDLANWEGDGGPEYRSRLRDVVQKAYRVVPVDEDEAPEIDMEYDCE